MAENKTVQQLAQNLDAWAQRELPSRQRVLLQALISRGESREIRTGKGSYTAEIDEANINIKKAVMDAAAALNPGGVRSADGNWPRSGYVWPRSGYIWPRSGYVWPRSGE